MQKSRPREAWTDPSAGRRNSADSTTYSAESVSSSPLTPQNRVPISIEEFDNEDFLDFARAAHELALVMLLNSPELTLPFSARPHYQRYSKGRFYCVDGFPKEGAPCVVVLPPPHREAYAYMGLRPAVLVLGKDAIDEDVLRQLQEQAEEKGSSAVKDAERGEEWKKIEDRSISPIPQTVFSQEEEEDRNVFYQANALLETLDKSGAPDSAARESSVKRG